jgi:hypothetical protein
MIGVKTETKTTPQNVEKAVKKAAFSNFRHAGFSIRKTAKESVKRRKTAGPAGGPVTTRARGGSNIRAAIFTHATKEDVIIGPRFSFVGESQYYQEFGEPFDGIELEERPTMHLALEANVDRFARDWQGSVGE